MASTLGNVARRSYRFHPIDYGFGKLIIVPTSTHYHQELRRTSCADVRFALSSPLLFFSRSKPMGVFFPSSTAFRTCHWSQVPSLPPLVRTSTCLHSYRPRIPPARASIFFFRRILPTRTFTFSASHDESEKNSGIVQYSTPQTDHDLSSCR